MSASGPSGPLVSLNDIEHRGSVGRVLDWGSNSCWFEPHRRCSNCVVSLSKTFYPQHSTGSTQEDLSQHD